MTNWEKYFGSPEKVMTTLDDMGGSCPVKEYDHVEECCDCIGDFVCCNRAILEWLNKEAD